ncbi:hypothetical protein ACGFW5_22995 [Streptomyces sp. NPDC048416]|uniref:hypothetical protein n=1 Tax=Streptomyces sp. NPDC048416 TaxID=3365546 RepID=UPI00371DA8AE
MRSALSGTRHSAMNWPRVKSARFGDSTWITPLVSWVCRGLMSPCGASMPIEAGTVTARPSTRTSRWVWVCWTMPSAGIISKPAAAAAAAGSVGAGHGGAPWPAPTPCGSGRPGAALAPCTASAVTAATATSAASTRPGGETARTFPGGRDTSQLLDG